MATMTKEGYQSRKEGATRHGWTKRFDGKTFIPYGPFYVPNGVTAKEVQQVAKDFRAEGFNVRTESESLKNAPYKKRVFLYLHHKGW